MPSSTPSILISDHRQQAPPSLYRRTSSSASSVAPMAIPRGPEAVPPPLPPPTYIPEISIGRDPGWQWGNDPQRPDFGRQAMVKPGSSLLGGASMMSMRLEKEHTNHGDTGRDTRHTQSIPKLSTLLDQTMTEDNGDAASNYRLRGERQLGHRTLVESSQSYDKHLLSRIGGPNTDKRLSTTPGQPGIDLVPLSQSDPDRRGGPLGILSMPPRPLLDSSITSRLPASSAPSPGLPGHWSEHSALPTRHNSNSTTMDENVSHRGSYPNTGFSSEEMMEDSPMGNLHLHDKSPGAESLGSHAGSKRRASSPPREYAHEDRSSVSSTSGHGEIYHRRSLQHLQNRGSPVSRFHPSVSPTSSLGPRHGSLGSSLGISSMPSSTTSYGSGRASPHGNSPAADSDFRNGPHGFGNGPTSHSRTYSECTQLGRKTMADSVIHSRNSSLSTSHGAYLCECCPKKPKRFDTEDQLRSHESEKQYTCAYCPNRFKNKNEAERHQNSLHLRLHSWSCAVLAGVESAFHASTTGNGMDVCGYCGEEFPNPAQWEVRTAHLTHVHKFGECNQVKKFFRADHFRQHLKHSHAGASGKWTNMLENACMKDEPPPERRVTGPGGASSSLPMITPYTTVIPETPHDT